MKRAEHAERENKELRRNLVSAEGLQRRAEETSKSLKDNRGKILRGLNTQTEIALVQFKRDFEFMKQQLESKDHLIQVHERKIKALVEANCTLRNGMHHRPRPLEDESEEEGIGPVPNGVEEGVGGAAVQNDLAKFIKQLDL